MANLSVQALQAFFAPTPNQNWTRRGYHASAIVGDYIYIDAGELTIGSVPLSQANTSALMHQTFPVNCTMVLPVGQGWKDSLSVQYQVIPKPDGPVYTSSKLWHDSRTNSLYSFGGEQSLLDQNLHPLDLSVWRLDLDGKGGGNWVKNSSATDQPFRQGINRPFGGAATFSNTTGYYAGGFLSKTSSPLNGDVTAYVPIPGIVEYSFANGSWSNSTGTTGITPTGSFEWGGMEHLPTLGPNGMIVFWGGETSNSADYAPGIDERPMDVITLLDPVTKQYYKQNTTGDIPPPRNHFCSVSVEDPRPVGVGGNSTGTWEIYMYSGWQGVKASSPAAQNYDNVWVLSIPSFRWTNVYSSQRGGRYGHTCHVVGKRQMLSIGGVDAAAEDGWNTLDALAPNGLAVFDMSKTQWTSSLDPAADAYERPSQLADYYSKQGPFPNSWNDGNLKNLLGGENMTPPPILSASGNSPSAYSPTTLSPSLSQVSGEAALQASQDHTRMLIGAITGSLAVFLLLPILLFFLLRRRKHGFGFLRITPDPVVEMSGDSHRHELGDRTPHGYRSSSRWRSEKRGRSRGRSGPGFIVELDAGYDAVEKPAIASRNSRNHEYYRDDCKKSRIIEKSTFDDWDMESLDSEASSFDWPQARTHRSSKSDEAGGAYPTVSTMHNPPGSTESHTPSPTEISPISSTQKGGYFHDAHESLRPRKLEPIYIMSNSRDVARGEEEQDMNQYGGAGMLGLRSPGIRWQYKRPDTHSDRSVERVAPPSYSPATTPRSAQYPSRTYSAGARSPASPYSGSSDGLRSPVTGLRKAGHRRGQG